MCATYSHAALLLLRHAACWPAPLPVGTPFPRSRSNWVGDAVNKAAAASPSVEALRNIRGGPRVSDVSDCISSSGQPSIWLGVCCPDPEPSAPGVSQGPAEAEGGCGGGGGGRGQDGAVAAAVVVGCAIKHNRGRPIRMCLL